MGAVIARSVPLAVPDVYAETRTRTCVAPAGVRIPSVVAEFGLVWTLVSDTAPVVGWTNCEVTHVVPPSNEASGVSVAAKVPDARKKIAVFWPAIATEADTFSAFIATVEPTVSVAPTSHGVVFGVFPGCTVNGPLGVTETVPLAVTVGVPLIVTAGVPAMRDTSP